MPFAGREVQSTAGKTGCPLPGFLFGSSALRASATKCSICRTPAITDFLRAVIKENLPINSALCTTGNQMATYLVHLNGQNFLIGGDEGIEE